MGRVVPSRLRGGSAAASTALYAARRLEVLDVGTAADRPEHSLLVYGTLAPGRENHHLLAELSGSWSEVTISGVLGAWEGYPMFRWDPFGDRIPAWLLRSRDLPAHYDRLDEFETDAYVRLLIPFDGPDGVGVANCYVAADPKE